MTRRTTRFASVALALAIAAGISGCTTASAHGSAPGPTSASTSTPTSASSPGPESTSTADPESYAGGIQNPKLSRKPTSTTGTTVTRVDIPSIGVDAPTEMLHRNGAGNLLPPQAWQSAGWYQEGTVPGQIGPAIIAGHIDSAIGPAVFARLDQLQPGATVSVSLSTGQNVTFVVTGSIDVSKDAFPTDEVYGPTPDPQLRLISCTGTFNQAIGHYDSNIVAFARLAS